MSHMIPSLFLIFAIKIESLSQILAVCGLMSSIPQTSKNKTNKIKQHIHSVAQYGKTWWYYCRICLWWVNCSCTIELKWVVSGNIKFIFHATRLTTTYFFGRSPFLTKVAYMILTAERVIFSYKKPFNGLHSLWNRANFERWWAFNMKWKENSKEWKTDTISSINP